jgi:hypothetical protein
VDDNPRPRKRGQPGNWKNNVEQDLRRLLDRKGVTGAFLISKNGETVAQVFQEVSRHKENTTTQLVKKIIPLMMTMRNMPLRRTVFETTEGSVIFYNTENGIVGCVLDRDYDIISVMLEVRTVGDVICSRLNDGGMDKQKLDDLLRENREEFRVMNAELLKVIENHMGAKLTTQLIERTVR